MGENELFVKKYVPKKFFEIVGNESAIEKIKNWVEVWRKGGNPKPLLIYGSPGVGKTTIAYVVANELDCEVIEINASDVRKKQNIEEVLGPASSEGTLSGRKRLIIIDEVDGIDPTDRGAVGAIVKIIESARHPIILIANDPYAQKIKELRNFADFVEMKKVSSREIFALLKKISEEENLEISPLTLREIADSSEGDVRSAIVDLQSLSPSKRDREIDIFKGLGFMFKAKDFESGRQALWDVDIDPETLFLWIDENIPNEYEDPKEIYEAYEKLSRADVFEGRIQRRQNWKLRRYSIDLATGGVSSVKKEPYKKFTKYRFPKILKELSFLQMQRAKLKNIAKKIGKKTHLSTSETIQMLPIMYNFIEKNPAYYELEEDELSLLKRLFR